MGIKDRQTDKTDKTGTKRNLFLVALAYSYDGTHRIYFISVDDDTTIGQTHSEKKIYKTSYGTRMTEKRKHYRDI